jgi:4-hydroxy-L-threonine phosphate dehydrogenase PdxA
MLLCSGDLRVAVVTGHMPLKDVAKHITTEKVLDTLKALHDSMVKDFGISKPKIAVLGLNPHAGENGTIGEEEKNIILPAVRKAAETMTVFGPYASDGFFGSGAYQKFDAILAMYHDQGLIPFKALAFNTGVNFTAGLSAVRTSPDHGTAYEIAGKQLADGSSFREALYLAMDIYKNRELYAEISARPLAFTNIKRER